MYSSLFPHVGLKLVRGSAHQESVDAMVGDDIVALKLTMASGMSGGPVISSQDPTRFLGLCQGSLQNQAWSYMVSVTHGGFQASYAQHAVPSLPQDIVSSTDAKKTEAGLPDSGPDLCYHSHIEEAAIGSLSNT